MGLVCPRMLLRLIVRFENLIAEKCHSYSHVPTDAETSVCVCSSKNNNKTILRFMVYGGWELELQSTPETI